MILAVAPLYVSLVIWAGNDGKDVYCYMFNCGTLTMLLLTVPLTSVLFMQHYQIYLKYETIKGHLE